MKFVTVSASALHKNNKYAATRFILSCVVASVLLAASGSNVAAFSTIQKSGLGRPKSSSSFIVVPVSKGPTPLLQAPFSSRAQTRTGVAAVSMTTDASSSISPPSPPPLTAVAASTDEQQQQQQKQQMKNDEIERLKAMAQKLRSEAAALEAEQAHERAEIARLAFEKFDTDPTDGKISLKELKAGLEKSLKLNTKTELLSDERVRKLMTEFDVDGDGYLQTNELVSIDQFRNKLESYAIEEKRLAREAVANAKKEEELAKLAEARLEFLNEKDPTLQDKLISVLPYLFPLLDSLQFGQFILNENTDNPIVGILAILYTIYRSIPFSGFLAYLALNFLSSNPTLNRLVRFNMQQAIFLDIALFVPGLVSALVVSAAAGGSGFAIDDATIQLSSTVVFGAMVLTTLYASTSSLLGISPNKIPFISKAVDDRMLTVDMFDEQGRFVPSWSDDETTTKSNNKDDNNKNDSKNDNDNEGKNDRN